MFSANEDCDNNKTSLVQVKAWGRQATSHYLHCCWLRPATLYGQNKTNMSSTVTPGRLKRRPYLGVLQRDHIICDMCTANLRVNASSVQMSSVRGSHSNGNVVRVSTLIATADDERKLQRPQWRPWPWFNIKMSSYEYRKSHCGGKTVVRSSSLHNGISYTHKLTSLYWFGPRGSRPYDIFVSVVYIIVKNEILHEIFSCWF